MLICGQALSGMSSGSSTVMQSQRVVTAYFLSEQLVHFGFESLISLAVLMGIDCNAMRPCAPASGVLSIYNQITQSDYCNLHATCRIYMLAEKSTNLVQKYKYLTLRTRDVLTLNQRRWRWFNVNATSYAQRVNDWLNCHVYANGQYFF